MRHPFLIVVSFSLLAGGCARQDGDGPLPEAQRQAAMEEVAATLAGLTEAMNAHDPNRVFSYYRQSRDFIYVGCTDVLAGWGTFESRIRPYYNFNADVTFQQEILNIQLLGHDVAAVVLRGSSSEAPVLFWTMVLEREEGGRWLITQEHESWPGCPVPRGPHMGTEGMPGAGTHPTPDPGISG